MLVDLPPGLVGNPTAAAQCTAAQLASGGVLARTQCPADSQVGTALVRLNGHLARDVLGPLPVYNLVPPPGVPARFGFNVAGTVVTLDGELRSGGDYGLSVRARDIPQGLAIAGTTLTFWGVPADPRTTSSAPARGSSRRGGRADMPERRRGAGVPAQPDVVHGAGQWAAGGVQIDSWVHPGGVDARRVHEPPATGLSVPARGLGRAAGDDRV